MLDTEYQAMLSEIDRLAANTTFNGNTLINANITAGQANNFWSNAIDIAVGGVATSTASVGFNANFTNSNGIYYITAAAAGKSYVGVINSNQISTNGTLISGTAIRLISSDASYNSVSGDNSYVTVSFGSGVNVTTSLAAGTNSSFSSSAGSSSTTFAFKVGTSGISANDEISLGVRGMNTRSLALYNSDVTTVARADSAAGAVTEAINILLNARSEVGAVQNRLETAQSNISTIIENIEAARSAYLDLDIAAEMATFTSKQILEQAGVSMLAQANQVPQNLLRLFQN